MDTTLSQLAEDIRAHAWHRVRFDLERLAPREAYLQYHAAYEALRWGRREGYLTAEQFAEACRSYGSMLHYVGD